MEGQVAAKTRGRPNVNDLLHHAEKFVPGLLGQWPPFFGWRATLQGNLAFSCLVWLSATTSLPGLPSESGVGSLKVFTAYCWAIRDVCSGLRIQGVDKSWPDFTGPGRVRARLGLTKGMKHENHLHVSPRLRVLGLPCRRFFFLLRSDVPSTLGAFLVRVLLVNMVSL